MAFLKLDSEDIADLCTDYLTVTQKLLYPQESI